MSLVHLSVAWMLTIRDDDDFDAFSLVNLEALVELQPHFERFSGLEADVSATDLSIEAEQT